MKNRLKEKLQNKDLALGLWVTLESASITEIATVMGLDWILVDAEHGHLGFKEIMEHVRLTRNTGTTPLVRIEEIAQGRIKRILDIGAEGILVPQVLSRSLPLSTHCNKIELQVLPSMCLMMSRQTGNTHSQN